MLPTLSPFGKSPFLYVIKYNGMYVKYYAIKLQTFHTFSHTFHTHSHLGALFEFPIKLPYYYIIYYKFSNYRIIAGRPKKIKSSKLKVFSLS